MQGRSASCAANAPATYTYAYDAASADKLGTVCMPSDFKRIGGTSLPGRSRFGHDFREATLEGNARSRPSRATYPQLRRSQPGLNAVPPTASPARGRSLWLANVPQAQCAKMCPLGSFGRKRWVLVSCTPSLGTGIVSVPSAMKSATPCDVSNIPRSSATRNLNSLHTRSASRSGVLNLNQDDTAQKTFTTYTSCTTAWG